MLNYREKTEEFALYGLLDSILEPTLKTMSENGQISLDLSLLLHKLDKYIEQGEEKYHPPGSEEIRKKVKIGKSNIALTPQADLDFTVSVKANQDPNAIRNLKIAATFLNHLFGGSAILFTTKNNRLITNISLGDSFLSEEYEEKLAHSSYDMLSIICEYFHRKATRYNNGDIPKDEMGNEFPIQPLWVQSLNKEGVLIPEQNNSDDPRIHPDQERKSPYIGDEIVIHKKKTPDGKTHYMLDKTGKIKLEQGSDNFSIVTALEEFFAPLTFWKKELTFGERVRGVMVLGVTLYTASSIADFVPSLSLIPAFFATMLGVSGLAYIKETAQIERWAIKGRHLTSPQKTAEHENEAEIGKHIISLNTIHRDVHSAPLAEASKTALGETREGAFGSLIR